MSKNDTAALELPPAHREDTPEPETQEAEKRTRSLGVIRVAKWNSPGQGEPALMLDPQAGFSTLEEATRFIRDSGEVGAEYAIIRLVARLRVAEEVKRWTEAVNP